MSDDPEHRALPLAWSPQGWGVYVNTMRRVEHAVGAAPAESAYVLTVDDAVLDLFLFAGEPGEILNQYTALTGRAGQPVLWAMGAWLQQASGEMPTQTVAFAGAHAREPDSGRRRDAGPAGGLGLPVRQDRVRMGRSALPGCQADAGPVPQAQRACGGLRLSGRAQEQPAVRELEDRGWLLSKDDGSAQVFDGIPATSGQPYGLLDLTYRDIYNLWVERHRQLIEDGLDAPACDAQIAIPDGVNARNGETGAALRSMYPLVRRALFDAVAGLKVPPGAWCPVPICSRGAAPALADGPAG